MTSHVEIRVPELGLDGDEVLTVSCWLVEEGDEVIEGDRLIELATAEITFDVAAPASGRLLSVDVETDEVVAVGTMLGTIEPDEDEG